MKREYNLPRPKNWQSFEELCRDLYRELWRDPDTQQNGRQGQAQAGVDVFGRPERGNLWAGVQCKGKDSYTDAEVTEDELRAEVKKAATFTPNISRFILATTAPRDQKIQKVAREITSEHLLIGNFTVSVCSWEDLVQDICRYESVLQKHFAGLFKEPGIRSLGKGAFEFDLFPDQVELALGRAFHESSCGQRIVTGLKDDLYDAAIELALNAYLRGGASWCTAVLEPSALTISYDGVEFDPLKKIQSGQKLGTGLRYLKFFLEKYADKVAFTYSRNEKENLLRLEFSMPLHSEGLAKPCIIEIPENAISRKDVQHVIVPPGCKTLYADLTKTEYASPSFLDSFVHAVLKQLADDAQLVVTLSPRNSRAEFMVKDISDPRLVVRK